MPELPQQSGAEPSLVAAVHADDVEGVRRALAAGENPRILYDGETPLHVAARRGSLDIVEALISGGALEWVPDAAGRRAVDVAREGDTPGHAAVVALLDRTAIADPSFRAAVGAVHRGDVPELVRLLDAEPRLLRERIVGPEAYRRRARDDYFRDPKLFWFVANNPTRVERMPRNAVEVASVMIDRGVDREDLDYTLVLVMTSSAAREQGLQRPLMRALLSAGATATRHATIVAAAERERDALRLLLEAGYPLTVEMAAALGDADGMRPLLTNASAEEVQTAFGLAVINGHIACARLTLDAGADVDAFIPVHAHGTALHDAAARNDVAMIAMLVAAGARRDIRDTLWDGTPIGWARHVGNAAAIAALSDEAPA